MGESTKNIDAIFEEARFSDAILVFDEAEGLFGSRTSMTYVCGDSVYAVRHYVLKLSSTYFAQRGNDLSKTVERVLIV